MPKGDVTKLPKWAQWEIERLTLNAEYAERRKAEAEAGFMERGKIETPTSRVDWTVLKNGDIHLTAYDGKLVVEPQASNSVNIRAERYR